MTRDRHVTRDVSLSNVVVADRPLVDASAAEGRGGGQPVAAGAADGLHFRDGGDCRQHCSRECVLHCIMSAVSLPAAEVNCREDSNTATLNVNVIIVIELRHNYMDGCRS